MSLAEKQKELQVRLAAWPDGRERLKQLVDQARRQPPPPPGLRADPHLIPGCLARLWLASAARAGRCHFVCDSDSQIVKAVAGVLCDFYDGETPPDILGWEPDFLGPLGITQHLTPNRRNALTRVREHIRQFAREQIRVEAGSPADAVAASPGGAGL